MSIGAPAVLIGVAMLAAGTPAAAARYAVYPVRSLIADDAVVGPRRTGAACLPAGSLRWSAFELRPDRAAADVSEVLRAAGVPADAVDPALDQVEGRAPLRISIELMSLRAAVCQPKYGLLKLSATGMKGEGTTAVRWRVLDVASGKLVIDETTTADFSVKSKDKAFGAIVKAGLSANALRIASRFPPAGSIEPTAP